MIEKFTLPTEILDDDLICFGHQCWSGKEFKEMARLNKLEQDLKPLPGDTFGESIDIKIMPVVFEEVKKE